jgi:hypothetical protein
LVAVRRRGLKYAWTGIGVLVLVSMYAAPTAAVFSRAAVAAPRVALPNLATPALPAPLLRVPKLHLLPALPAVATAPALPASKLVPKAQRTTHRKLVRRRIPVVSDRHSQVALSDRAAKQTPHDPFADAPVVDDAIGQGDHRHRHQRRPVV